MTLTQRSHGFSARLLLTLATLTLLAGCATGYNTQVSTTMDAVRVGAAEVALADLEAKNADNKDKDLLYFFEKGELQRMSGNYQGSVETWLRADEKVRAWEDQAKLDPAQLWGNVGSVLLNDTTRRYDGRDYEKVLLSVRLALDHLALGNWDAARVEIKKMHEREAIIASFRAKDVEDAKAAAEGKGLKTTSFKELNGYPVETLEAPEVLALKNAYESAVANYLAGFVYEALGEPSLASAGYRKAIELSPSNPFLDEGLKGLDGRASGRRASMEVAKKSPKEAKPAKNAKPEPIKLAPRGVDTLILVESGLAPAITSRVIPIPLPIPTKNGASLVITPISWPVVEPVSVHDIVTQVSVNGQAQPLALITSVDHMARRALKDEMPGIIARTSVRAIVKGAAQKAIQDNAGSMGMAGVFVSLAAGIAAVATEQADERSWRTLPAFYSASRVSLPPGEHTLSIQTAQGVASKAVQVSGKHALIVLRTSGQAVYLAQTPYVPPAVAAIAPEPEPVLPAGKKSTVTKSSKPDAKSADKVPAKPAVSQTPSPTATPKKETTS
jgi:uncharacterized protein